MHPDETISPKAHFHSEISLDISPHDIYTSSNDCIVQNDDDYKQRRLYDGNSSGRGGSCFWYSHLRSTLKRTSAQIFRRKTLHKRLPIVKWLPAYNRADFVGDLMAGITVGLTVIPQGLAYASIAGVDLQYGLYGCFMGCFIYMFLGSSKDVPVGPTAISALLTFQAANGVWEKAILLSFLSGLIEIAMGIFRLGFLIDFVSGPVSAGFTSACSLIIFTSQLKDLLGVNTSGNTFVNMWISIVNDIHNISWNDAALGVGCIIILLALRTMASLKFGPTTQQDQAESGRGGNVTEQSTYAQKFLTAICWTIGSARNAVLVLGCMALDYYLLSVDINIFRTVGYVPAGLPRLQPPPFSMTTITTNSTDGILVETHESFTEMVGSLGSGLIVVPLIALLENMAVVQAFADGKPCDATQELIAVGVCNVANSFAQGICGNGGIARGAVLNSSGARTQLSNLYTGGIVIVALLYLTPAFYYIPKATLAAVIMAAVIFMIQYRVVKPMWRSKKSDLFPGLGTFFACLVLSLQLGILVGIGINILFILYHAARPKLHIATVRTSNDVEYLMLTPDRCLIFPSAEFVRNVINKQSGRKSTLPVVLDCTHIYGADFTAARVISTMMGDFEARKQKLYFYNLRPRVAQVFEGLNKHLNVIYDNSTLETVLINGQIKTKP